MPADFEQFTVSIIVAKCDELVKTDYLDPSWLASPKWNQRWRYIESQPGSNFFVSIEIERNSYKLPENVTHLDVVAFLDGEELTRRMLAQREIDSTFIVLRKSSEPEGDGEICVKPFKFPGVHKHHGVGGEVDDKQDHQGTILVSITRGEATPGEEANTENPDSVTNTTAAPMSFDEYSAIKLSLSNSPEDSEFGLCQFKYRTRAELTRLGVLNPEPHETKKTARVKRQIDLEKALRRDWLGHGHEVDVGAYPFVAVEDEEWQEWMILKNTETRAVESDYGVLADAKPEADVEVKSNAKNKKRGRSTLESEDVTVDDEPPGKMAKRQPDAIRATKRARKQVTKVAANSRDESLY